MKNKLQKQKIFFSFLLIVFLSFTTLEAKVKTHITTEKKGQKIYMKNCSQCHGAGNLGGNMSSMDEWEELLDNKAKELIKLHKGEENTVTVINYLKSEKFNKRKKYLINFLKEFANDSDYIPTCY